jgi:hypothetical protein
MDALRVLLDVVDLRAVEDAHARRGLRVGEEDGLQVDLVDAVRRLGRGPPAVGAGFVGVAVLPRRNVDARQLLAREGGAVRDVVGMVCGQAGAAQRRGHAEAAQDLHGARGHVVALHAGGLARAADLGHQHGNAALRQIGGQGQPDGAGAHDQDLGLQGKGHGVFGNGVPAITVEALVEEK